MEIRLSMTRAVTALIAFSAASAALAQSDWTSGGSDLHNTRSQSSTKINSSNVAGLHQKWAFTTHGDVSATPTVKDNKVYAVDWGGYLYSIDAKTGVADWSHQINDYTGNPGNLVSIEGLPITSLSRTSPAVGSNEVIIGDQGFTDGFGLGYIDPNTGFVHNNGTASVMAVKRSDGSLLWRTVVETHWEGAISSSPVIYNGKVYVGICSLEEGAGVLPFPYPFFFRGKVACLDENTGTILWQTTTTLPGYAGASVWGSTPVVDVKRGSLYVATGNNYAVPNGSQEQVSNVITPGNNVDSVMALDLQTGHVKWATSPRHVADTWNVANIYGVAANEVTQNAGPDYDFGSGPNMYTTSVNGVATDIIGAGEKSGQYWALDPNTGNVLWGTQIGPGGTAGGIEWGSATDGQRIYCAISNSNSVPYTPMSGGPQLAAGLWGALDASTGNYLWQLPDPLNGHDFGMVSVANGVMYAGSLSGTMYAIDGGTGNVLWSFAAGASVNCGPAITDDSVYWGSGYSHFFFGTPGNTIYAFTIK